MTLKHPVRYIGKAGYEFLHWERDGKKVSEGDLIKVTFNGEKICILPVYEEKKTEVIQDRQKKRFQQFLIRLRNKGQRRKRKLLQRK